MANQLPRFCIRCGEKIEDYSNKTLCNKCIKELKLEDTLPDSKTIPQKEKPIKKFPKNDVKKITIPIDKRELKDKEKIVSKIWKKGDIILDLYEIKGSLGEGGMGEVHKVYHKGWKIDLAVKRPKEEALDRAGGKEEFIDEAETWIDLGLHPNIVSCYYVRKLGGIPLIFIEYMEGGSLTDWIRQGKLTELKDILDIAIQFAWGLNYAHEQQIYEDEKLVHKDVKPANVLLTKDGTLKITDFGLSKARGGMTPEYCSPEQALQALGSNIKLTLKTDIYSFAVSMLEMFIGERTWEYGEAAPSVLEGYIEGTIPKKYNNLPNMPEELITLLKRCFQKDPQARPKDMLEISDELISIYEKETNEKYFREKPEEVKLRADSLNNRALTLLDLGKIKEAENIWKKALEIDSHHPEATYNLGLLQWRNARKTDIELVRKLEVVKINRKTNWRPYYLLGIIHLERGDKNSAEKMLNKAKELAPGVSDIEFALIDLAKIKNACYLRSFEGHKKYVNDIAIAPSGKRFVSASSDNTLKLWDINSGTCLRTFVGHKDSIYAVAITFDRKYVVSGSDDKTLKLWDINTGKCLRTFEEHKGWVNCVVITADGKYIVSGSNDKTLKLWDINTGKCLRTFEGHGDWIRGVDVTSDGKYVVSGSNDKTIKLWDLNSGKCLRTFLGHKEGVNAVAITIDSRNIISGSFDNTLKLWDLNSGKCIRTFVGHKIAVQDLAITPDERFIISGSLDDTLRLWDLNSGECLRTFEGHKDDIRAVAITQDGKYMVSSSKNNKLWSWRLEGIGEIKSIWALNRPISAIEAEDIIKEIREIIDSAKENITTGRIQEAAEELHRTFEVKEHERYPEILNLLNEIGIKAGKRTELIYVRCKHTFEGHERRVNSIDISSDGKYVISSSSDMTLKLWDLKSGKFLRTFMGCKKAIKAVTISPDGKYIISGDNDMKLKRWDLNSKICLHTFEGHEGMIKDVDISPDGHYAISGSDDNTLKLWDLQSCKCIQTFKGHKGSVESVAITPEGEYVISGSDDNTLKLWDLQSGGCLSTFEGHEFSVSAISITPDGHYAISGSDDNTLKLWDLKSGKCLRTFIGHGDWIRGVDVTSDGKYVVSGSNDKTIKLWDINDGKCLRTFKGHKRNINDVSVTSDGRYILSGSSDKTIKVWQLDWDYEFPEKANWDEGAKPYLKIWLNLHTPYSPDAIKKEGKPNYTEEDFKQLLYTLACAGYGWLREEGVRKKLEEMALKWKAPQDWYESTLPPPPSITEYERKVKEIERRIEDRRKAKDIPGKARAYHDLGLLHLDNKKYSEAKSVFERVLDIYEELDDKKWMGTCYVNLGIVNMHKGNYNQAEKLCKKGLILAEETDYRLLITLCYHNLGVLYDKHLNQPEDALEMYEICLRLYKEQIKPIPEWLPAAIQRLRKKI